MTSPLVRECPEIRFKGRFADLEALNIGDTSALTPTLSDSAKVNWAGIDYSTEDRVALVLGANGFVGAHLAAHLSRQDAISKVYATARTSPCGEPADRFRRTLQKYRIADVEWSKIHILEANPTRPNFALSDEAYGRIEHEVDIVANCASSTDYGVSYLDLRNDWVVSLLRVMRFCASGKPKHFTYLGSIGRYFYSETRDFHRPESWWYSGYSQMKWVNAQIVESLGDQGLPVTLCDTHYVLGSTTIGLDPGRVYSLWRTLELARSLGAVWEGEGMNYVPVDVLVDSITRNSLSRAPLKRMLPRNLHSYTTDLWAKVMGINVVPFREFHESAIERFPQSSRTLVSTDLTRLIRVINAPEAVFPAGVDTSWSQNEKLFDLYMAQLRLKASPTMLAPGVTDLASLEMADRIQP